MKATPLLQIPSSDAFLPVAVATSGETFHRPKQRRFFALLVGLSTLVAATREAEAATLENRYSFDETSGTTAFDPIGGQDGTLLNGASFSAGEVVLSNPSGPLSGDPSGQYVDLPDDLVAGYSSITMETWFTPDLDDDTPLAEWSRVWDFGNSNGTVGVPGFMLLRVGDNTTGIRVDMTPPGNGDSVDGPPLADLAQSHVVFTLDSVAQEARLYVNGELVGVNPAFDSTPLAMGPTMNDWLGRSQFAADPYLNASIAELRIWDGALSPLEVAASYQYGPDIVGPPPVLSGVTLDVPGTLQLENSVQARVFVSIAGLPDPVEITGDPALSYASDDPNLSVDSDGRITADALGGGTITVTYDKDGIMLVDDQFINVTHVPATLLHRYSFSGDDGTAVDSVGMANGTIHPEATQAGGSVSMTGGPLSYVELPPDLVSTSTISRDAVTFEAWASFGSSPIWARLFDFGDRNDFWGGNYIFFTPNGPGDDRLVASRATPAAGGFTDEDVVAQSGTLNGLADLHVVCVVDFGQNRAAMYFNGVLAGEILSLNTELSDIVNNYSYLGKSLYSADGNLVGSIDEFRIYDGAMVTSEITANYLNGPDDFTPPELTLVSGESLELECGDEFIDPGVMAVDDFDGDVTANVEVSGSVDWSTVGIYTLTYTVTDAAGNSVSVTRTVTVEDTSPPVVTITGPSSGSLYAVGENVDLGGLVSDCSAIAGASWTFSSPGSPDETLTATVTGSEVGDTVQFGVAGIYAIKLEATDEYDSTGVATTVLDGLPAYVVVYDPSGGFVTGGGWIWSPAGALHPGLINFEALEGKAIFGFVSKYKKGATVPTGQTEFNFQAGNLNFHSSSYDWLVVAGARGQFKGDGTINGEPGYGFMLTGIDGAVPGGNGADRFRIKIWDILTEETVYDNQAGSDDDAALDEATLIHGGNIVIHKQ